MARPIRPFRDNPKVRIVAILLTVLLGFYAVGAILKTVQKRPDQPTPENELAKSLVDSKTPPMPGQPGETPVTAGVAGPDEIPETITPTATQTMAQPEAQPLASPTAAINPASSDYTTRAVPVGQAVAEKATTPAPPEPPDTALPVEGVTPSQVID